ncbi:acetate kinase [Pelagicoccus sp. SDUM812002]|uniref:acetate/propionate family kinase n=1 Tax=Pelagicoccus sp. SDUM812002 TaxID=3041266 RepID=UPI0028109836|nr:acetate kinase [Pelagicoccus sp. SDUM812002]MDQ8185051.1 acetate kinase [Pelagicoccus sp. SDUM812002]
MNILVINCGSSSLKFSVIDTQTGKDLARGLFDKLGSAAPSYKLESSLIPEAKYGTLPSNSEHEASLDTLADFLASDELQLKIEAVGHRVVHGGEHFTSACLMDQAALDAVKSCSSLAPLHNPANLLGIESSKHHFPDLPQVGVFDTAFHQTIAPEAYLYSIPIELYVKHGIRRYGFHGSSHKYVTAEAARILGKPLEKTSIITAHLGNGCSAAAIENGACIDTTMGLTPLEGLVMGTRSGDIDPGIIFHLHRSLGMSIEEIDTTLNKKSGLFGLSGFSNDMRSLRQASAEGSEAAQRAVAIFTRRLAKSIAGLRATLTKCDALVFTGGIGENDAKTRAETLARLEHLGIKIDSEANSNAGKGRNGIISQENSPTKAIVIPTNEELMIARETEQLVGNQ